MKHGQFDPHSLPAQVILSFVALVLLTALAVGLPAIWLIHDQLERQAWAQVEQGRLATRALYQARQAGVKDLATLLAQRPTLGELLLKGKAGALSAYLQSLQVGAGLDMVLFMRDQRGEWFSGHRGELDLPGMAFRRSPC